MARITFKGLVTNYGEGGGGATKQEGGGGLQMGGGGGYKVGGGACEVLPLRKGGGVEKLSAMLKGGDTKGFELVFMR